ncbi:ABC transporter ATP-binding protein [Allopusillimonas soli]|uniref:ABC transporter ATP-binding protein n=2 Tax=Allopusillimonas soli TaxID=659016 RepID=A0A853FF86_9BURK|nr:ABC transporter ATP-binding protein [Allopusillimonas soli]TEA72241.1 ABC transporter ATP-binding protein [Allopusillimonas soli]
MAAGAYHPGDEGRPDAVLTVRELSVQIAGETGVQEAVKALSLTIARGQTFALVGESGCGKSMTALALLRLLPEAARIGAGRVWLDDTELNSLPERGMRAVRGGQAGIIFQEPSTSLNPVMTVGQQLSETLRVHTSYRGKAQEARAAWWLERVGIPQARQRLKDYPHQFSGGQKQRIMIAIALAAEPRLLIADEPTTALDVTVQAQILDLLADIQRDMGLALLLITHDLAVVKNVADQVALMRAGEIVETSAAAQFFDNPRHPYARELLSAIPGLAKRGRRLSGGSHRARNEGQAGAAPGGEPAPLEGTAAGKQARAAGAVLLEVRNLSVEYAGKRRWFGQGRAGLHVVRDVGFTLRPRETLALLGESGCGKTTTAKALLRLLEKQAIVRGQALMEGVDLIKARGAGLKRLRRHIQIVFQDPYASLDPRMLVGEILEEGVAALHPERSRTQRQNLIRGLLDRVGLPRDTAARYPHEFSGGQRQRIAIARALAVEPRVLVCDEPTSALDVSVQAQILDLLRELQAEFGIAYLFITHNFGVVEYLADRIAVMHEGRIVESGPAQTVLAQPADAQTRRLLQAVPRL